jgi:hypothetical protein
MKLTNIGQKLAQNLGQLGMGWCYDKSLELARQWFRETHDLDISVERCHYIDNKAYEVEIQYKKALTTVGGEHDTYEIALRTALFKACQMVI